MPIAADSTSRYASAYGERRVASYQSTPGWSRRWDDRQRAAGNGWQQDTERRARTAMIAPSVTISDAPTSCTMSS